MKKNILLLGTIASAFAASAYMAFAQAIITVPTSTAQDATAAVGQQLTDDGTYKILLVAVGIPLFFYVVHKLMGLFPGRKARSDR
jgi:hypothetical protein